MIGFRGSEKQTKKMMKKMMKKMKKKKNGGDGWVGGSRTTLERQNVLDMMDRTRSNLIKLDIYAKVGTKSKANK